MMTSNLRFICNLVLTVFLLSNLPAAEAASKQELDAEVKDTLSQLYKERPSARELGKKARGILVFPTVMKGGFVVGGEYGEGALLIKNRTEGYYNTVSASVGFQLGAQARSQVIMFMTDKALKDFRNRDGWEAGVDGSVAIAEFGAGGSISTETAKAPIIGFILDNKGLMYNLTLEGSKISKIKK